MNSDNLEVCQEDREAAAEFAFSPDNFNPDPAMRLRWREVGEQLPLVQAFARHRLSSQSSPVLEIERLREALNYVADMTCIGSDAEWHFKPGYDPQVVLDAIAQAASGAEPADPARVGGVAAIAAERRRQIEVEGWTPEHDDEHGVGELARAAACYADPQNIDRESVPPKWPWDATWWKPRDARSNLVRAGALIAAEIDRLDRQALDAGEKSE